MTRNMSAPTMAMAKGESTLATVAPQSGVTSSVAEPGP